MRRMLVVVSALLLTACATTTQVTRDQWLGPKARTYPGATPGQVLRVAEQLFTLADGSDFQFVHAPSGDRLTAIRRWMIWAGLFPMGGSDTWIVTAAPHDGQVRATVETMTQTHSGSARRETPQVFELFWSRMDYLLGR